MGTGFAPVPERPENAKVSVSGREAKKSLAIGARLFSYQVTGTRSPVLLGNDVGSAGAFLALLNIEGDALALGQRLET